MVLLSILHPLSESRRHVCRSLGFHLTLGESAVGEHKDCCLDSTKKSRKALWNLKIITALAIKEWTNQQQNKWDQVKNKINVIGNAKRFYFVNIYRQFGWWSTIAQIIT